MKKYYAETLEQLRLTRKTLRTTITDSEGFIKSAKINLLSGEITQHVYYEAPRRNRLKITLNDNDADPAWTRISPPSVCLYETAKDRSYVKVENTIQPYIQDLEIFTLDDVYNVLPMLENIITGAKYLDIGGNTRPIANSTILSLLKHLEIVSTDSVQKHLNCSKSYARKVATVLRIIVHAFNRSVSY